MGHRDDDTGLVGLIHVALGLAAGATILTVDGLGDATGLLASDLAVGGGVVRYGQSTGLNW